MGSYFCAVSKNGVRWLSSSAPPRPLRFILSRQPVLAALLVIAALVSGCREDRSPGPPRRPVAEREYREVEALEWRAFFEESELAPYLSSPWPKVRARAVMAFSRVHGGETPRLLLERWRVEDDSNTRAQLVFALRDFERSSVIEALETASEDEDVAVRLAVATALRDVRNSRTLGEKLSLDADPVVRSRAVLSLALSQQADASFWSERLLKERDQSVRWALYAGASFEPPLARALEADLVRAIADRNYLVGTFALDALERLEVTRDGASEDGAAGESSPGLAATLSTAGNEDVFWIQREAAVRALALRLLEGGGLTVDDRQRIESLLLALVQSEALPDEPSVFRYRLVRSLCALGDPAVVPRLRELAASPDAGLRTAVAHGLADVLGPSRSRHALSPGPARDDPRLDAPLRELLDALRADDDESVRAAAARVTDAGRPAVWALADPSPRVRAAALEAGIAAPSPPVTASALRDPDPRVRRVALERALNDDLPLDPGALRPVAMDPSPWRWTSRLPAMDLFCRRHPAESRALLEAAIEDPSPVVLRHAIGLARLSGLQGLAVGDDVSARAALVPGFPLVDRDPIESRRRPRVIVGVEGKESFVVELHADETPVHASSFLALARGGYYTGRRVLAIDVANGVRFGRPDRHPLVGQPLRPEASLLPFTRGSLVSAPVYSRQGECWDAAGEWQITLLPRPELSGRATCWGRVYIGMHVVDRLEPGDRISSVEVVD